MDCPTVEGLLSRYERGELTASERECIDEHVASCHACKTQLSQYAQLSQLCGSDVRRELPGQRKSEILAAIKRDIASEAALAATNHDVLSLEEAAAFLRVDLDDLTEELDSLPVFEVGGRLRIRRSRLVEWIEERERQARSRRLLSLVQEP